MQRYSQEVNESSSEGVPSRTVWDRATGREWRVRRSDCRNVPGARGRDCLVFDCGTMVRRVWSPPSGWRDMTDAELLGLVADPAPGASSA